MNPLSPSRAGRPERRVQRRHGVRRPTNASSTTGTGASRGSRPRSSSPTRTPKPRVKEITLRAGDQRFAHVLFLSRTSEPARQAALLADLRGRGGSRPARSASTCSATAAADDQHRLAVVLHRRDDRALRFAARRSVASLDHRRRVRAFPRPQDRADRGGLRLDALARLAARPELEAHEGRGPASRSARRRNICASTSGSRPSRWKRPETPEHLIDVMGWIGWDKIMFASDYPHWDFDDPFTALPPSLSEAAPQPDLFRQRQGGLSAGLAHVPEKWEPVFRKDMRKA